MLIRVSTANGLAIYEQIARQVKFAVACEALRAGEMVPSVRELARQLAVNPNTVARAYRDLQADEVLEPLRGEGLRVTERAPARCRQEGLKLLRERLRAVLIEARQSHLSDEELRALIDDELGRSRGKKA